jgi:hypothetical protein
VPGRQLEEAREIEGAGDLVEEVEPGAAFVTGNMSLELQRLDKGTEFLKLLLQLVAPCPRRQLASDGFERYFALEKRRQPL